MKSNNNYNKSILELNEDLSEAISSEDYETAAKIRDMLKEGHGQPFNILTPHPVIDNMISLSRGFMKDLILKKKEAIFKNMTVAELKSILSSAIDSEDYLLAAKVGSELKNRKNER